jgi:hypothetical protein
MTQRKKQKNKTPSRKLWIVLLVVLLVTSIFALVLKDRLYSVSRPANVPDYALVCRKNFTTIYISEVPAGLEGEKSTTIYDSKGQVVLSHTTGILSVGTADGDSYEEIEQKIKTYETEYTCKPGETSPPDSWFDVH